MTLPNKELGAYLKYLRDNVHLSTREVYDLCGVSNSYLSLVENGHRKASAIVLKKLASIYNTDYLDLYEKAGYIDLIEDEKKKKYNIDELGNSVVEIPILGIVKAGYNYMVNENIIGYTDIPEQLSKSGTFFALRVKRTINVPSSN